MPSFDSIVVGEDWISEHYFTTDSTKESFHGKVVELRKQWDADAKEGVATVRSSLLAAARDLAVALAGLAENPDNALAAYTVVRDALGYPKDLKTFRGERAGSELEIPDCQFPGIDSVLVLQAHPVESIDDLLTPETGRLIAPVTEDGKPIEAASKAVSAAFRSDTPPAFVIVQAGQWLLLAEAERWAEGRYLAVDLLLAVERRHDARGGEIDRVAAIFGKQSVLPDADGNIWWAGILEDSVKHTVGVSKDLREGIRLSIEIIANEVVRRRRTEGRPMDGVNGQDLAKHSLRFLYRILFLLYAEASPEMQVLPTGAPEYGEGYGLDRLRDLTITELVSPRAKSGTHLYKSLSTLFRLVDSGHTPPATDSDDPAPGLEFNPLRADLFSPDATALIDEVGLGNEAVQRVLEHLLLSKEAKGNKKAERGFISYAELGINQLGAVYEGLMSYTGFFAGEDLYEVAKGGNTEKGSWVVPIDRADHLANADFVKDAASGDPVIHRKGTFVFRLAGRERQQSASYYTPEVLTKFVVSQALEELLDQNDRRTTPEELLNLTICEPALGSGAFAIEAVRQLATEYLKRQQEDLGELIDADQYPVELQKVKAYIALHQVYGVDLNATAVELAEISLWLDTMVAGLQAPWFGLHLRRGNSLIGARRATISSPQLKTAQWISSTPSDVPLGDDIASGAVHHFLLPCEGWGSAVDSKEAKTLAPEALTRMKEWKRPLKSKLHAKNQIAVLQDLALRVERLWEFAQRRLEIAEEQVRRDIGIWGAKDLPVGGAVTREQIQEALADPRGSYQRLRRVMDAWCALWFWPLTEELTIVDGNVVSPPSVDEWIDGCKQLLGFNLKLGRKVSKDQGTLASGEDWLALGEAEENDLIFAGAIDPARVKAVHPWLEVCERIAARYGYFHWELDFASVFARGGFDLQVGNPPWVRPRSDVEALLAEADPWWQLKSKSTATEDAQHRAGALAVPGIRELVLDGTAEVACTASFVGSPLQYPHLAGLQPDLYRCFMEQTWRHAKSADSATKSPNSGNGVDGVTGLIHPETHFTDEKAGHLRSASYSRLRRHWAFVNELILFEIDDKRLFGIHIYGGNSGPNFLQATYMYHPDTVVRSLKHDGSGSEPGLKDDDGKWDLRPHASRIQRVDMTTLATWHAVLETEQVPVAQSRMVYTVNRSTAAVLDKLAKAPRIGDLGLSFSAGWHEKNDRTKGYFDSEWGVPESWDQVILQGPHLHVATPFYKSPNPTMLHNQDWTAVDLEALAPDAIPATSYKPRGDRAKYDAGYTHWQIPGSERESSAARDFYRIAWRRMAANTGERTLISAIIPPKAAHVNPVHTCAVTGGSGSDLVVAAAFLSSLVADFSVRSVPKSEILFGTIGRIPFKAEQPIRNWLVLRAGRLTCLTTAYAELWAECFDQSLLSDAWANDSSPHTGPAVLAAVGPKWGVGTPLRRAGDRRQAQIEIDALVSLALGLTADELITIYRTQFPVLSGYDRKTYIFDGNGRVVPNAVLAAWRTAGTAITSSDRTVCHAASGVQYEHPLPFTPRDRETDLREAYSVFAERLANRRSNSV